MTEEPLAGDEEKPLAQENYWETAEWGPWPTRRNNFLAAGLASVFVLVLVTAVTLVMLIHYDGGALTSLVANFE
ncbi:hypothetical protein CN311_24075 [Mesorhizobium sanjuanii]|uniref:Uncharacterized protein n=1 Tax=Mesorhizobium sanjuanii TaxID=2037900 RepID=A0A2A6F9W9_9HYPH|nr:hypothetical protein [Mesorhizobium sanjuanii]PDQ18562.1 hypothetical protein CN311_24075 [Mesorhizobium sanjuanii]